MAVIAPSRQLLLGVVERALAAGLTEAPRPSPRLDDSLEIMEFLTTWERCCLG